MTSKFHALTDALGRLVDGFCAPGQSSDAKNGPRLCAFAARVKAQAVCGDKAYDSNAVRALLGKAKIEAVIPSKINRVIPIAHDKEKYKKRNRIERFFRRIKESRRIILRSDKRGCAFEGWIWLVSGLDWLNSRKWVEPSLAHTP